MVLLQIKQKKTWLNHGNLKLTMVLLQIKPKNMVKPR